MRRPRISTLNVLALLAVLIFSSAWVPWPFRTRGQGRVTHCKSSLKNIGTALEMYAHDHKGSYPSSLDQLVPKYLKQPEVCPIAKRATYRLSTGLDAPENTHGYASYYYVDCYGENHRNSGVEGNYPAYDGVTGLIERRPL